MQDEAAVLKRAVQLLSRREHARQELEQKLLQKGAAASDVALVLDRLANEGLQSDERFTECFVRQRSEDGFGPNRIQSELRARGVSADLVSAFLAHDREAWEETLQRAFEKRVARLSPEKRTSEAGRATLFRYMLQRGFPADWVRGLVFADTMRAV